MFLQYFWSWSEVVKKQPNFVFESLFHLNRNKDKKTSQGQKAISCIYLSGNKKKQHFLSSTL